MPSEMLVAAAEPFSPEKNQELAHKFMREGCLLIPDVLTQEEVAGLKDAIDRVFADPRAQTTDTFYGWVAVRLFEWDNLFRDMLVREPIISLMETILGKDCHLLANNCVRNPPGQAIDIFHADIPDLFWPSMPDDITRFDDRLLFPCYALNVQIPLTNIESIEYGPTQYVPFSHYSGRNPNDPYNPTFEGHGPETILCKTGDIYLQHSQVWHRGAPNTSDRVRYLHQQSYCKRFVSQKFYPFLNYKMPDHVIEGASERLLRVLGKHAKSAYG